MMLNRIEKALMNNPVRRAVQRHYEARLFERLGGRLEGKTVLEIGCGSGVGAEIILDRFGAERVEAFDLDPDMIKIARERLRRFPVSRVRLGVGDASRIDAEDASFDAVFDFGIIHHVPEWRLAVAEVRRVLKPGGLFYFEEVTRQALNRWAYRIFLEHPRQDRFSAAEFVEELAQAGFSVHGRVLTRVFGDFMIGVASVDPDTRTVAA